MKTVGQTKVKQDEAIETSKGQRPKEADMWEGPREAAIEDDSGLSFYLRLVSKSYDKRDSGYIEASYEVLLESSRMRLEISIPPWTGKCSSVGMCYLTDNDLNGINGSDKETPVGYEIDVMNPYSADGLANAIEQLPRRILVRALVSAILKGEYDHDRERLNALALSSSWEVRAATIDRSGLYPPTISLLMKDSSLDVRMHLLRSGINYLTREQVVLMTDDVDRSISDAAIQIVESMDQEGR